MQIIKNSFIDASTRWRNIRDCRDKEIIIFNELTTFKKSNTYIKNNYLKSKILFFFKFIKLLKLLFFVILKNNYFSKKNNKYDSLIVCAPSRLKKIKGSTLTEKIKKISITKSQKGGHGKFIREIISSNSLFFIPAYEKEKYFLSSNKNTFGSHFQLMNLIIELGPKIIFQNFFTIISKSKNVNDFFELILLLGVIKFLKTSNIKKVLLLTSNSRTSEAIAIGACVLGLEIKEYLHGVPTRFIYERDLILKKSPSSYSSIRLVPINKYCTFSGNKKREFFNFNLEKNLLSTKNRKVNKQRIIFAGCASHFDDFLKSDVYKMEKIILKELSLLINENIELIYCPHPEHKIINFNFSKKVKISNKGSYFELINATHCLGIQSSIIWEAKFLGLKGMICIQNPSILFKKDDLKQVDTLDFVDKKDMIKKLRNFVT